MLFLMWGALKSRGGCVHTRALKVDPKESVFNVLFNVLFLVLDFPLGAPNTLLKHVIERSIWRIVVGEGSWWGWGFSQDW